MLFKKAQSLGFLTLSVDSNPSDIGAALLKHWHMKVKEDAVAQGVDDRRIFILLKSKNGPRTFALYEAPLRLYEPYEIEWKWTDVNRMGLQGADIKTGMCIYRWYHGQKQFFERFVLPLKADVFQLEPVRLRKEEAVRLVEQYLRVRP